MSSNAYALHPDWEGPAAPFKHTWAPVANIDQFRWLSRADVHRHLALARDEVGVRHVRAVAMFSPELGVWDHDLEDWRKPAAEKAPRPNWQMIDLNLEALLDLGLKPVYTTCFTPAAMTDDPTLCWPDRNRTGMPRDLDQWDGFIHRTLTHHLERFGRDEMRSWYFEVWNEPNLKGCFFGGDRGDFFRLWDATWRAFRSVDPAFRLGGPSTARAEWLPEFLDHTARQGTRPDYLITHVYNNDSEGEPLSPFDGPAAHRVKDSPHFAAGVVKGTRKMLGEWGYEGEVHWNEWGRSWFLHDPLKETALEPAFIVKTMAEVSQEADAFAFWCLSDIYNQGGYQYKEFQGNYGLLSLHGLRKPGWFAHMLLERLGDTRVVVKGGDDLVSAVATPPAAGKGAAVLVYAYPTSAVETGAVEIRVEAPKAAAGMPTLTRLGSVENNVIAAWRAMGSPAYPTRVELDSLRRENQPLPAAPKECRQDGKDVVFTMERPGVALLKW